ncbi:glycosyltransferase family 2 protein [Halorussus gelatinilyticus]|uniref:Glycosyltransferase family 2 protein n=1 Tax=Halorussus gelatinilyticus TaxID=2937524 RepID=A0A8U0IFY5_9EURY|nr:glycosyltransferase family A protein [Halorussus gelatinilyticus]UPV99183.1 glycosyltransferase family 2 protein [Halorussus gelatinilyticus]
MELSVVVPTLNGRERLASCLDALAAHAPDAEVVVVNGPSADGTTGMIRERDDVDVLVEVSDRKLNVARNAGLSTASGDAVALVGQDNAVEPSWSEGVREALADPDTDAVTGPVHRSVRAGVTAETEESRTIDGREVTYFEGGNVAFTREAIEAVDGFDEYLVTGGARDCAHRLAANDYEVEWSPSVCVIHDSEEDDEDRDWGWKYRALAYRLVKTYGPRPGILGRTLRDAIWDGASNAADVIRGEQAPSGWIGSGKRVAKSMAIGCKDGLWSRLRDRSDARNPSGLSARADRAVEMYDWRTEESCDEAVEEPEQ